MPIKKDLASRAVAELGKRLGLTTDEAALGIARVSASTIVKAIRRVSVERGHNPRDFILFAFGGAGPLCAIDVAREMGISTIIIPPNPGILCAEGLQVCDRSVDLVRSALIPLDENSAAAANKVRSSMLIEADAWCQQEEVGESERHHLWTVELRYKGQNFELAVPVEDRDFSKEDLAALTGSFNAAHEHAYGFSSPDEPIEVVNLKLKVVGALRRPELASLSPKADATSVGTRKIMFARDEWVQTPVFQRLDLAPDQVIEGPAVIEQLDATSLVYPGDRSKVDRFGNLFIYLS